MEIGDLSASILSSSFPGLNDLVAQIAPQLGGLFVVRESLLDGMWLMLSAVMCEKLLSQFIVAQTAIAVSERLAEEELAMSRSPQHLPSIREEVELDNELVNFPDTMLALSPAARYTSASGMGTVVYSGLPRVVWKWGIRIGLMVPVDLETPELDAPDAGRARFDLDLGP